MTATRTYSHHCLQRNGHHEHESYIGDRTKDSLVKFADDLAAAVSPHTYVHGVHKAAKSPGCNFAGGVGRGTD